MTPFSSFSDEFGIFVNLNTKMDLAYQRETVLHFFDSMQKSFPQMTDFDRRDSGEIFLEEDRELGSYRWLTLEPRRVGMGYVNPPSLEDADAYHERVLEVAPFHLSLTNLDCEALDVVFSFDFVYSGNHDEVVAEALAANSPFEGLARLPAGQVLHYEPNITLALDENCRLQCRLGVETRTSAYQIRVQQFPEAPISVYLTVRQFWGRQPFATFAEAYRHQCRIGQELLEAHVVPNIVRPLSQAIAARQ